MTKRKNIPKKKRFEVFKRDSFSCQYCGSKAPDVVLNIDHINPVSKGGDNDILNLITSCFDCNSGKSDNLLSDNSVIEKQRRQLDDLQEKNEQMSAIFKWKKELANIDQILIDNIINYIDDKLCTRSVNTESKFYNSLKKLTKKHKIEVILDCIDISFDTYAKFEDGEITEESASKFMNKIGGVIYMSLNKSTDDEKRYYYIRGIINNRFSYCNKWMALDLIKKSHTNGYSLDDINDIALSSKNWSLWRAEMEQYAEDV